MSLPNYGVVFVAHLDNGKQCRFYSMADGDMFVSIHDAIDCCELAEHATLDATIAKFIAFARECQVRIIDTNPHNVLIDARWVGKVMQSSEYNATLQRMREDSRKEWQHIISTN